LAGSTGRLTLTQHELISALGSASIATGSPTDR
jgi:hypothetical protein